MKNELEQAREAAWIEQWRNHHQREPNDLLIQAWRAGYTASSSENAAEIEIIKKKLVAAIRAVPKAVFTEGR